jgi:isoleucyl-tRNA synthetase
MFKPVKSKLDITLMEEAILKFWKEEDIFHQSMKQREGKPEYVFFEGPPTANGKPGTHHVLARAFKDVFPRYRTMCGY